MDLGLLLAALDPIRASGRQPTVYIQQPESQIDLYNSIPLISQYIPIQVHQIPHIILLSFLSTGVYRKVYPTSCFEATALVILPTRSITGSELCSTIDHHPSFLIQSSTNTQSCSLSVLPKHRSNLTLRTDIRTVFLPQSSVLIPQELYQILNTRFNPLTRSSNSSAPNPYRILIPILIDMLYKHAHQPSHRHHYRHLSITRILTLSSPIHQIRASSRIITALDDPLDRPFVSP